MKSITKHPRGSEAFNREMIMFQKNKRVEESKISPKYDPSFLTSANVMLFRSDGKILSLSYPAAGAREMIRRGRAIVLSEEAIAYI